MHLTAKKLSLVSAWQTLRVLRRMLLDRGLLRKINLRLTSSASYRVSSPHHLTQCSPHKHEQRSWVALQEEGTLFGILSEGETKAIRKKSRTLTLCWLDSIIYYSLTCILLSFIYIPSDCNKTDLGALFCTLFFGNPRTYSASLVLLPNLVQGLARWGKYQLELICFE